MNLFVDKQPIALTVIFSYLLPSSNHSQTIKLADLYNFIVSGSTIQKSFAVNNLFWLWLLEHKLDCKLCIGESHKLNASMSPIDGHCFWREECRSHFANRRLRRQWFAKVSNRTLLFHEDVVSESIDKSLNHPPVNAKGWETLQSNSPPPTSDLFRYVTPVGIMSAAISKIVNYFSSKQKNRISPTKMPVQGTLSKKSKVIPIEDSSMVKLLDQFLTLEIKVLLEGKRDLKHCHVGISQLFQTEISMIETDKSQTYLDQLILTAIKQSDWKRVKIIRKLERKSWIWSKSNRHQQEKIRNLHQIVEDMRESVGGSTRDSEGRLLEDLEDNIFWYKMQLSPLESLQNTISSGLPFDNPFFSLTSDESRALLVAVKLLPCAHSINTHRSVGPRQISRRDCSLQERSKNDRGGQITMAAKLIGVIVIPLSNGKENLFEDFESNDGSDDNGSVYPSWTDMITIDHPPEYCLESTI